MLLSSNRYLSKLFMDWFCIFSVYLIRMFLISMMESFEMLIPLKLVCMVLSIHE